MSVDELLYYPAESAELLHTHLERFENPDYTGIKTGLEEIDDYLLPLMDGDLGVVLARPGHGKSMVMIHMARNAAQMVIDEGENCEYAPPLYVSNEMPVEELGLRNLSNYSNLDSKIIRLGKGKNNWKALHSDVDDMTDELPIIYLANSLYSSSARRPITIEDVDETIDSICQAYGKRPRLVCIDYWQRMMTRTKTYDRRLMLSEVVERSKDWALKWQLPVLAGSQANRAVEQEKFPVPSMESGKETGNIEETADWAISTFRPSRVWKIGELVPYSKEGIIVTMDLFFVMALKQRNGDAGKGFWISMDPRITRFSDLELKYNNPNLDKD